MVNFASLERVNYANNNGDDDEHLASEKILPTVECSKYHQGSLAMELKMHPVHVKY